MQRLYCYVDETGQDPRSDIFIVVAVITDREQDSLRTELIAAESEAKTGQRKWHKSRPDRRIKYLKIILAKQIAGGDVFFAQYSKPLPYFLPLLETIEKSIKQKTQSAYRAVIIVDGIDRKKATELTGALRLKNISLEFVRTARDESEPIIRLADMWAGCLRSSITNKDSETTDIIKQAQSQGYLKAL